MVPEVLGGPRGQKFDLELNSGLKIFNSEIKFLCWKKISNRGKISVLEKFLTEEKISWLKKIFNLEFKKILGWKNFSNMVFKNLVRKKFSNLKKISGLEKIF